jgi:hypothetical protein
MSTLLGQTSAKHLMLRGTQPFPKTLLFLKILLLKSVLGCLPSYLCLILPKTDFLLVNLPKLSKLSNPTVTVTSDVTSSPVPQARNDVFRLILIYHFWVTFRLLINLKCLSNIRDPRRIRPILNQTTTHINAVALVHSKLTTVTLFSLFLQINWIVFSLFLILLPVQSINPQNFMTYFLFLNLSTGSKFLNEYIKRFYLSFINVLSLTNLPTAYYSNTSTIRVSSSITLKRPRHPFRLQITNRSFHSVPSLQLRSLRQ